MLEEQIQNEVERLANLASNDTSKQKHKKIGGLVEYYKEPLLERILNSLFENDLKTTWRYVVDKVIVPKARGLLADIFIGGIQKAMFDDEAGGYGGYTPASGPGRKTSYDGYYKEGNYYPATTSTSKPKVRWDRIVMRTRPQAVDLLESLKADIRRYKGGVSVLEMYDYVTEIDEALGAQINSEFPDNNWGWTNLDHVPIETVPGGYWVKFPKPVRIN